MKRKKGKTAGNKLTSKELQYAILRLFRQEPKKRLNPRQIIQRLRLENNKDSVTYALQRLIDDGSLEEVEDYKFRLRKSPAAAAPGKGNASMLEGIVDMTRSGAAYIVCEGQAEDIYVSPKYMNSALHGDKVRIHVWQPPGRRRREGEVLEVLQRAREQFIGTFWQYPKYAIVAPDITMPLDILVDTTDTLGARDGDKVVVRIENWAGGQ